MSQKNKSEVRGEEKQLSSARDRAAFIDYINGARDKFVKAVEKQDWNKDLRVAAEDILIAYDQMGQAIAQSHSVELREENARLREAGATFKEAAYPVWELKDILEAFNWTWDNMGKEHTADHFNIPANGINRLQLLIESPPNPPEQPGEDQP